jgi:arabinofuranosyltransferase
MSEKIQTTVYVLEAKPEAKPARRWLAEGFPLLTLLVAFLHAFSLDPSLIDDAFISFRYSANLASGQGLVFNSGEHVEGFSNMLWTLLMAVAYKAKLSVPYASWVLGLVFMLLAVYATIKLIETLTGRKGVACLGGVALGLSTSFVASSLQGLETSLFAALLALAFLGLFTNWKFSNWLFIISLMLLSITRAEGMILSPIIVVFFLFKHRHKLISSRRPGLPIIQAALVPIFIGGVELWRILYYGEFLPMSVIAKRDGTSIPFKDMLTAWRAGLEYVIVGLGWQTLIFLLFSLIIIGTTLKVTWKTRGLFYLTSIITLSFALVVAISNRGDWMPYVRLLTPYFPVLVALFVVGISDLMSEFFGELNKGSYYVVLAWVAALLILQPATQTYYLHYNISSPDIFSQPGDKVGYILAENYQPGDVYANGLLGRISYYARPAPVVDMLGLTEPRIAKLHKPGSNFGKIDTKIIGQLRPTFICNNNWILLTDIVNSSKEQYVGVMSKQLIDQRIFIFIRADAAERLGKPLINSFGGELIEAQTAFTRLKELLPNGT